METAKTFKEYCKSKNGRWVMVWLEKDFINPQGEFEVFLLGRLDTQEDCIVLTTLDDKEMIIKDELIDIISECKEQNDLEAAYRRFQLCLYKKVDKKVCEKG